MKLFQGLNKIARAALIVSCMMLFINAGNAEKSASKDYENVETNAFKQNEKLGRGMNIPSLNRMEEKHFKKIKEAGFNNVRIPIGPFSHVKSNTDFTLNSDYFETLDKVVNLSLANGLMAIIDFHEHHAMSEDPLGNKPKFLAIWKQIANRYKDYPNTLLFEIANEPNMKPEIWNSMLKEAHYLLRQSNPDRTILIGSIYGNQIKYLQDLELPEQDRNIIVSIHYYMPIQFTHQGAAWSEKNKDLSGIEWTNEENEELEITTDFDMAKEWASKNNRPLHLGEFGVYEKAGLASRIRWTKFVTSQAENRNWSWSYWEFNSGFGVYDMGSDEWNDQLLDALISN